MLEGCEGFAMKCFKRRVQLTFRFGDETYPRFIGETWGSTEGFGANKAEAHQKSPGEVVHSTCSCLLGINLQSPCRHPPSFAFYRSQPFDSSVSEAHPAPAATNTFSAEECQGSLQIAAIDSCCMSPVSKQRVKT